MSKTKKDVGAILHHNGVSFRVWAPFAESVAVTGAFNNWGRDALVNEGDGYWEATLKTAEAGQEYKYVIVHDGNELFKNDPRSLQMTTSSGNSVIVDQAFNWEDVGYAPETLNKQVIYELHIGTFNRADPSTTGTFQDATEKLDYLADLGINMIEIMPIGTMAMDRGWGYAPDYMYAVESLYGGRHAFLEFVQAAHAHGIGVILDVVYNHIGPDGSLDIWQFDGWSQDDKGGIYFYNDWRSNTPWGETRPDYGRVEVQQYILDNARMWLNDFHIDGLRLDSTIYMRSVHGRNDDPSDDLPEAWLLMQRLNAITHKINPEALVIAEDVGANEYITKPKTDGGAGFDAQWRVSFPHVLREALDTANDAGRNIGGIAAELAQHYNGDVFQKIVYSDSHDSDANGSSRLGEEISPGNPASVYARQRSLLAATIVLTAPGVPMLFQGQEFMQGGSFSDWEALDWSNAEQFGGIVQAYRHLIALRKNAHSNAAGLSGQSIAIKQLDEAGKVLAYHRWMDGGPGDDVMVVLNFTNETKTEYAIPFPRSGSWDVRFNSSWHGYSPEFTEAKVDSVLVDNGTGRITLPPYAAVILSQNPA
jgi:1,4-alpha-glucan branching enzyme